jgi:hypothetical protein
MRAPGAAGIVAVERRIAMTTQAEGHPINAREERGAQ